MNSDFNIEIRKTGVRNTTLKIHADGRIVLTVPPSASAQYIDEFLARKQKWLQRRFTENALRVIHPEKQYVSGETFRYLGRQVRLKIQLGDSNGVAFSRGALVMTISDKEDINKKRHCLMLFFLQKPKSNWRRFWNASMSDLLRI